MNNIATSTFMDPIGELFRDSPIALGARLGCRGKCFILNELSSSTLGLVGQHIKEHAPGRICDMFSKTMVFEHPVDVECFDSNEAVPVSDEPAVLVKEVQPLVGYPCMTPGNFVNRFPSVGRAFLFPAQSPLELLELPLGFDKEAWVRDCFPITQRGEVLDADINANFSIRVRVLSVLSVGRFNLTGEDCKPLTSTVTLDCHGLGLSFRCSMQDNWNVPYLRDMQPLVGKQLKSELRVCDAIKSLFEARKPNPGPFSLLLLLNPAKEVFVCLRKPISTVLKSLRENGFKLRVRVFDFLDDLAQLGFVIKRCAISPIFGFTSLKKRIIEFTAQIKLRIQSSGLFSGRIQPKFIVPEFHVTYLCIGTQVVIQT